MINAVTWPEYLNTLTALTKAIFLPCLKGFNRVKMKLAVTGKGGTGKTTLSVLLARYFAKDKLKVILVDADPALSLATALGIPGPNEIIPISEMQSLINERMGVKQDSPVGFSKLNPRVDDLPEKY